MNQNHNEFEPQAIESPSTELTEVLAEGNFDNQLAMLERKAFIQAIDVAEYE